MQCFLLKEEPTSPAFAIFPILKGDLGWVSPKRIQCQMGYAFGLLTAQCRTQTILCTCFAMQITVRFLVKLSCAASALKQIHLSELPIFHLSVLLGK